MKPVAASVLALTLTLFGCESGAAPREISFNCGDLLSGPPDRPLSALDALLGQNPRARCFRVTWGAHGTLGGDHCWVFYDRKAQVLRLKHIGEYFVGDDDDAPHHTRKRSAFSTSYRFMGVSRARLHRLMRFYSDKSNSDGNDTAFLTQLPRFGCSMKITQDSQRTYYPN